MRSQFSVLTSDCRKLSAERKDFPAINKLFKSLLCLVLFVAALGAKDNSKKAPAASGLPPIMHWDHADGMDLFPRARIWLQKDEYTYYTGEACKARVPTAALIRTTCWPPC